MTESVFDRERFLDSLGRDAELARELLVAFQEDSVQRSGQLRDALDRGDGEAAARFAHSLKGMCGVVRCQRLTDLAMQTERAAKAGDLEGAVESCTAFSPLLALAHEEMDRFLESG